MPLIIHCVSVYVQEGHLKISGMLDTMNAREITIRYSTSSPVAVSAQNTSNALGIWLLIQRHVHADAQQLLVLNQSS